MHQPDERDDATGESSWNLEHFAGDAVQTWAFLLANIARLLATDRSEVPVFDDLRPTATASCKRC